MEKINVTIDFELSETGRLDAVKKGKRAYSPQTLTGPVNPELINTDYIKVNQSGNIQGRGLTLLDEYPESAQAVLETWKAEHEAKTREEAERKAERDAYYRKQQEEMRSRIQQKGISEGISGYIGLTAHVDNRVPEDLQPAVQAEIERLTKEHVAAQDRKDAERAKKAAIEAEEKAERDEYARQYAREHGDENQRSRLEAGRLPLSEAYDLLKEEAFRPYEVFPDYVRMRASSFNEFGAPYDFSVEDIEECTAEQWDLMTEIQKVDATAKLTLRKHTATDRDGDVVKTKFAIRVERTLGPVTVAKAFAADAPEVSF